ncbi:HTH-type transcriptional regulator VirS [Aquamicrobium terrae]
MLRSVGLDISLLEERDQFIPVNTFFQLLALSAKQSGHGDFGIRAACRRGIPDLGPVSLLAREAENVEHALGYYKTHLHLHSEGTVIRLDRRFDKPVIIIEVVGNTLDQSIQATQFCVTGTIMQLRWLIGENYHPNLLCFSHSKPINSHFTSSIFKCEIGYNQILSGIVLDSELLKRCVVTSAPFLRKLTHKHLGSNILTPKITHSERIKSLIRSRLSDGNVSSSSIASSLGVDRRTVHRYLANECQTYSSVLRDVRVDAARIALYNSNQNLSEVAQAVGFDSVSAFSRWFKDVFGCTPSSWKKTAPQSDRPFRNDDGPEFK